MMKRIISALTLILLLCTLASCAGKGVDNPTFITDGKTDYRLVIDNRAGETIADAAIKLVNTASKNGIDIEMILDSRESGQGRYEVLLGETDRDIPKELYPEKKQDFVIAAHEDKIIILGGSDEATVRAAEYFAEAYIDKDVSFENGFIYRDVYSYTKIYLSGERVDGITVSSPEDFDATGIKSSLYEDCGLGDGDTLLIVEKDTGVPPKTIRFSERDGSLIVSASSDYGLGMIGDVIANEMSKSDKLEFDDNSYRDFTYTMPDITELIEGGRCYITGATDKSPLEYGKGEEMVLTLTLYCDGEEICAPGFFYTVEKDYSDVTERHRVDNECSSFEIRTTMEESGFVKVYAAATSENGAEYKGVMPFNGGIFAGFDEIMPAYAEPDDFDEFWQGEIAALNEVLPEARIMKDLSADYPGYNVYEVFIETGNAPATAYVSVPENAEPGTLPILAGFMDYGVFSTEPSVKENTIVIVVNAHSIENGREDAYYENLMAGTLYSYGFSRRENAKRETVYFKSMILRALQAVRYAKSLPEWDGVNIELNGKGQGAYQTIAVAAFDPDVSYVYAAYPWLCDMGGESTGRLAGWYPDYSESMLYFDCVSLAKRVDCELEIVAGLGDTVSAPSGVAALANSLTDPADISFYQGVTHSYVPPETEPFKVIYE